MTTTRRVALCAVTAALAFASPAEAIAPLRIGFFDGNAPQAQIDRASAAGAEIFRINVAWASVAPANRPANFDPSNPSDPAYRWTDVDAAVRRVAATGAEILMTVDPGAPRWAEGPHMPSSAPAGSWRPDPRQFAAFAHAFARRYSGSFPDPTVSTSQPGPLGIGNGSAIPTLPRIHYWQAWNEPNLWLYLTPQWVHTRHGYVAEAPTLYRNLLNAFYGAVKGVDPSNTVLAAGTAPYGDPQPGGLRIMPLDFMRRVLCLRPRCHAKTHFDAFDHHPYGVASPTAPALNADDVTVIDLHKLTSVVASAVRSGTALPRIPKQLWVTEISWDSNPPDPRGVPIQTQARWLEQSFEIAWREGARVVMWLQITDSPPVPDYASTYQAGLYYLDGRRKPSFAAFRFPFVADRRGRNRVQVWGKAPTAGRVTIERRRGRRWIPVADVPTGATRLFQRNLQISPGTPLRARIGDETSLAWT